MGYYSSGDGTITLFKHKSSSEFVKYMEEDGWNYTYNKEDKMRDKYTISFNDWKVYCVDFGKLAEFGDFEIEIHGETNEDMWKLRSINGVLEMSEAEIIYSEWKPFKI